jgi:hypothetical protein
MSATSPAWTTTRSWPVFSALVPGAEAACSRSSSTARQRTCCAAIAVPAGTPRWRAPAASMSRPAPAARTSRPVRRLAMPMPRLQSHLAPPTPRWEPVGSPPASRRGKEVQTTVSEWPRGVLHRRPRDTRHAFTGMGSGFTSRTATARPHRRPDPSRSGVNGPALGIARPPRGTGYSFRPIRRYTWGEGPDDGGADLVRDVDSHRGGRGTYARRRSWWQSARASDRPAAGTEPPRPKLATRPQPGVQPEGPSLCRSLPARSSGAPRESMT